MNFSTPPQEDIYFFILSSPYIHQTPFTCGHLTPNITKTLIVSATSLTLCSLTYIYTLTFVHSHLDVNNQIDSLSGDILQEDFYILVVIFYPKSKNYIQKKRLHEYLKQFPRMRKSAPYRLGIYQCETA